MNSLKALDNLDVAVMKKTVSASSESSRGTDSPDCHERARQRRAVIATSGQEEPDSVGYNAETDKFGNMVEMGIIDPTVVRSAITNALPASPTWF